MALHNTRCFLWCRQDLEPKTLENVSRADMNTPAMLQKSERPTSEQTPSFKDRLSRGSTARFRGICRRRRRPLTSELRLLEWYCRRLIQTGRYDQDPTPQTTSAKSHGMDRRAILVGGWRAGVTLPTLRDRLLGAWRIWAAVRGPDC